MKHTPGPWYIEEDQFHSVRVSRDLADGSTEVIADAQKNDGTTSAKANARLIAAAPELYEALVALVNNPTRQAHYVAARAILKRIEG